MMKTAMQQLIDKLGKHAEDNPMDRAAIQRVLPEVSKLLPIEQEHLKYMHKQGYSEGYNDGRHEGEHVDY